MSASAEVHPPMSRFATELHDYLTAGFPALCVNTYEEERLLNDLRTLPPEWKLAVWSYTRGWQVNSAQGLVELQTLDKAKDPCRSNPPGAVASIGQFDANTVCVFFDLHTWFPMHLDLTRVIRDTLDVAKGTNRPMLFCSPDFTLPAELLKDVTVLAYDLPTVEQLG